MPSYPGSIPSIATLTGSDYPKAEHLNAPNREIEAIQHVLGINPRSISPVPPRPQPQTLGEYLDMLAYIAKTLTGAPNWYDADVPLRSILGGGGSNAVVAAGATVFGYMWGRGLVATENLTQVPMPFAGIVTSLRVKTNNAQPGTGSMVVTMRKNGTNTSLAITFAAGAAASVGLDTGSVSFAAGDLFSLRFVNNASGNSAQVGAWSIELDQAV